jgi:putative transposase
MVGESQTSRSDLATRGTEGAHHQPKRGRLWLNDGSCIRLCPEYSGHVWAYDFVEARTHDGRKFHILTIIDEVNRECPEVARADRREDALHHARLAVGEWL